MKKVNLLIVLGLLSLGLHAQTEAVGRVAGELAVSSTGAAVYTVPFALPPGIGQAVPALALTYNSQGGEGIAGWGWNIAGLSTITRVGATRYHDGLIDPVDFDEYDRFALDGQRLLLKNPNETYGANKTEYQTENYSNLTIVAHGQLDLNGGKSPAYFIVYYPDGSRAWYGQDSSFGALEWAISRWEDPQGNRIDYSYSSSGGVLQIESITYGGQSKATHLNSIEFTYEDKKQRKINYINGTSFNRNSLLTEIQIRTHQQNYRTYELNHDTNSSGYERLIQVVEKNANGVRKPPIEFNYRTSSSDPVDSSDGIFKINGYNNSGKAQKDTFSFDPLKHELIPGDFNGDGYQDMIIKDGIQYRIIYSTPNGLTSLAAAAEVDLPEGTLLHSFVAGHFQDENNSVLSQQGFVSISQKIIDEKDPAALPQAVSDYSQTQFTTYAFQKSTNSLQSYSKTWDNIHYNYEYNACGQGKIEVINKTYYPADFTGDGLSDILMVENSYTIKNCPSYSTNSNAHCDCTNEYNYYRRIFLVDMDRQKKSNFVKFMGGLLVKGSDVIQLADFDGDGIPDLWHFFKGGISVYKLYGGTLQKLTTYTDAEIFTQDKHTLIGDFNGDDKTDVMIPHKSGSSDWNLLTSTGKNFKWDYLAKTQISYRIPEDKKIVNYYLARDVDGDGVSDLVTYKQGSGEFSVFQNRTTKEGWRRQFVKIHSSYFTGLSKKGRPLDIDVYKNTFNPIYVYLAGDRVYQKALPISHRVEMQLNRIDHQGKTESIFYDALGAGNSYLKAEGALYPLSHVNSVLTLPLVSKVSTQAAGLNTTQQFKYYGAISHAQGLGFLGFLGLARTNSYGLNAPALWSLSRHDPQLRGALTHSWQPTLNPFFASVSAFDPDLFFYVQKTTYQYLPPKQGHNKVFIAPVDNIKIEDGLNGFTTHISYRYDSHYNPTQIVTERDGGKTEKVLVYSNKASARDRTYHLGRVEKETTTETWNGKSFKFSKSYTYQNNLVQTQITQGNGKEFLTERFTYDPFGNLTERQQAAAGLPSRKETYRYTADGRFLEQHTDLEGLSTHFSYHPDGTLHTETDPFGKQTTYRYDGWQRPSEQTDYLGKTHKTEYYWLANLMIEKQLGADGSQSQRWIDPWGRTVAQGQLGLDEWHWVTTRYDAAGRPFQVSEPYTAPLSEGFPLSENQEGLLWTTTLYDSYGRLRSKKTPSGKTLRTTYVLGQPTTTVNDGYQAVTTTLDARGNIALLQDPNGKIHYTYHPSGKLAVANYETHTIEVGYDEWGRKTSLVDPTAGTFEYRYDTYGQLLEEHGPKGSTYYRYTPSGKLDTKKQKGDHTELSTDYSYDPTTRLLSSWTTRDGLSKEVYSYGTTYDAYQRPKILSEQNGYARFSQILTYDAYGRVSTDQRTAALNGGASQKIILNNHYSSNGMLNQLTHNNQSLWELKAENARGQATEVLLGNGITQKRSYDALGYLDHIEDGSALVINYTYNKKQGVLSGRKRNGITESFGHDQRNRLTRIQKGLEVLEQRYDDYGRLADNPKRGEYQYTTSRYVLDSITLNASGLEYYKAHPLQEVAYNLDRKAVSVHEHGFGRADFAYNADMQRTHAWYGGEEEALSNRTYEKHYSSLIPAEITKNNESGETTVVLYIGGDAYTAPMAQINDTVHYLHRDYLGSILALTDPGGSVVEERQFSAWGEIDFFRQNGVEKDFSESILTRGFTGHEHFTEIALIHMNGRMYDPQLRRFLSPDNHIQDPYDTRSFDRFGYVWNNPLMNVDISGESFWRALKDWFKRNSKIITIVVQVAVSIAATVLTAGIASPILAGAIVGGSTGFTGGFIRTLTQGGNIGQALLAGVVEGAAGAISGIIGGALFSELESGVALGKNPTKLAKTGVGKALRNYLAKEKFNTATRGLFAFGTQLGGQYITQKIDEYYENQSKLSDEITPKLVIKNSNNSSSEQEETTQTSLDNSDYGTLSQLVNPFNAEAIERIFDNVISALEKIAFGGAGVNLATFTGGGASLVNEKPVEEDICLGNPLIIMEITSSGVSGKYGGTFGCTRKGIICEEVTGKKSHDGIDLTADVNTTLYSTHSGIVHSIRDVFAPGEYLSESYGNYVIIKTEIDGNTHFVKFNHLNKISVKKGDSILVGNILGFSGNTGNANSPVNPAIPHVHMQVFDSDWKSLDPLYFVTAKFDENFKIINNCK